MGVYIVFVGMVAAQTGNRSILPHVSIKTKKAALRLHNNIGEIICFDRIHFK